MGRRRTAPGPPRGRPLRTYHCTCLLDHEAAHIRDRGLRPLSRELVEERIDEARAAGIITADEADLLHRSHVYRGRDHGSRSGQVWLFAGQAVLADPINLRALLTTWGGEGMYMERMEPRAVLERLGRPAIVAVDLDLTLIDPKHLMSRLMAAFRRRPALDADMGDGADPGGRASRCRR